MSEQTLEPQFDCEELQPDELFDVVCFYQDESYVYIQCGVPLAKAIEALRFYSTSVAAKIGALTRILMTDMLDRTCVEWINGEGIVFPLLGHKE